jgi:hypothetical protein
VCHYWCGECPGRGWWWREPTESNKPPWNVQKLCQNVRFPSLLDLKIAENANFYLKVLNKNILPRLFLRIHEINKNFVS